MMLVAMGWGIGLLVAAWTATQARTLYAERLQHRVGDGMRELVARVRRDLEPNDVAQVVHPMARRGWQYYMERYEDVPISLAGPPRLGANRTVFTGSWAHPDRLAALPSRYPDARQIWVFVWYTTRGDVDRELGGLTGPGWEREDVPAVRATGRLVRYTQSSPGGQTQ